MIVSINNPLIATGIFSLLLAAALLISLRPRPRSEWFPASVTAELKGLAILMIVLSHIGYFLVSDNRFLWPLSTMAGIGVNLFLFLSGFGLTVSQLQKKLTVGQFYRRRLWKLFIPLWIILVVFLSLDFFILKIQYSWQFLVPAVFGLFRHADLYQDFNSPLWYFTFILGYYLVFPLVFLKKRPWLSALILYLLGYLFVYWQPAYLINVSYLYKVHIVAFPLGIFAAWVIAKIKKPALSEKFSWAQSAAYYGISLVLLALFVGANIYSDVGGRWEQTMSIIAVLAITGLFILKKVEFKILYWLGIYSYEIYLWHWPLMYRYDIFYRFLPDGWEGVATALYLILFIGIGWLMGKAANWLSGQRFLGGSNKTVADKTGVGK